MKPINSRFRLNSRFLILFCMLYVAASTAADAVAYNFSTVMHLTLSGATIIFPFTYVLGDIISEVYGWKTAMKIVWLGLLAEIFFALLIMIDLHMPPALEVTITLEQHKQVLGNVWLFVTAGVISNAVAGLLNVYFISRWKVLMRGKFFWLRSILSTCISEFILIIITVMIAFLPFYGFMFTWDVFVDAYILEILYALIFVFPAQLFVNYLKKAEGIDNFDYGVSYNPFIFKED
jgi:uncharacterized integral membrane protein (TIGR00697 family)